MTSPVDPPLPAGVEPPADHAAPATPALAELSAESGDALAVAGARLLADAARVWQATTRWRSRRSTPSCPGLRRGWSASGDRPAPRGLTALGCVPLRPPAEADLALDDVRDHAGPRVGPSKRLASAHHARWLGQARDG